MLATSVSSGFVTTRGAGELASMQAASDEAAQGDCCRRQARAQSLYLRHKVRVYRFVLRLTGDAMSAEDIVHEVFLDVWRQADGFKAEARVSTWILAIARHKALSVLRIRPEQHSMSARPTRSRTAPMMRRR